MFTVCRHVRVPQSSQLRTHASNKRNSVCRPKAQLRDRGSDVALLRSS
jgi:hypothetical protein